VPEGRERAACLQQRARLVKSAVQTGKQRSGPPPSMGPTPRFCGANPLVIKQNVEAKKRVGLSRILAPTFPRNIKTPPPQKKKLKNGLFPKCVATFETESLIGLSRKRRGILPKEMLGVILGNHAREPAPLRNFMAGIFPVPARGIS